MFSFLRLLLDGILQRSWSPQRVLEHVDPRPDSQGGHDPCREHHGRQGLRGVRKCGRGQSRRHGQLHNHRHKYTDDQRSDNQQRRHGYGPQGHAVRGWWARSRAQRRRVLGLSNLGHGHRPRGQRGDPHRVKPGSVFDSRGWRHSRHPGPGNPSSHRLRWYRSRNEHKQLGLCGTGRRLGRAPILPGPCEYRPSGLDHSLERHGQRRCPKRSASEQYRGQRGGGERGPCGHSALPAQHHTGGDPRRLVLDRQRDGLLLFWPG